MANEECLNRYKELRASLSEQKPSLTSFRLDVQLTGLLHKENFAAKDIFAAITVAYFDREKGRDVRDGNIYADKVFAQAEKEVRLKRHNTLENCLQALRMRIAADLLQHNENDTENLNANTQRKGDILLSLMLDDGYTREVIKAAIAMLEENHEITLDKHESDVLLGICTENAAYYDTFRHIKINKSLSEKDLYKRLVSKYLKKYQRSRLTAKTDVSITTQLISKLMTIVQDNLSSELSHYAAAKIMNEYYKKTVVPSLITALKTLSPVALLAWVDADKYASTIMQAAERKYHRLTEPNYEIEQAAKEYNGYLNKIQELQKNRDENPQEIVDTEAAKRLIENRCDKAVIMYVLESKQKKQVSEASVSVISAEQAGLYKNYSERIYAAALKSLQRERKILHSSMPHIPEMMNYFQLQESMLTANDIYTATFKKHCEFLPNQRLHMSDEQTDIDIAVQIMSKYNDFSEADLRQAIEECSPRQCMAGINSDYAFRVVTAARQEIDSIERQNAREASLEAEFRKQNGFAYEPESGSLSAMDKNKDCRTAVNMLEQNYLPDDIIRMIMISVDTDLAHDEISPQDYAERILEQAAKVKERKDTIISYDAEARSYGTTDEGALYLQQSQQWLNADNALTPTMDIGACVNMLLQGVSPEKIRDVIQENSPVAAEAGRGDDYFSYVENLAQQKISAEKTKLKDYVARPRQEPCENIQDEYLYQREKILEYIDLPYSEEMNTKIITCLTQEKYQPSDILNLMVQGINKILPAMSRLEAAELLEQLIPPQAENLEHTTELSAEKIRVRNKDNDS